MLERSRSWRGPLLVTVLWLLLVSASACTQGEPHKAGERTKEAPVAQAATGQQSHLDSQRGLDSGGGFLTELHVCVGIENPGKCERGALLFKDKCDECHHDSGLRGRSGPTLVGLLGRERRFVNGQSLIADRSYIRRSIVDHNSDDEYVPGYGVSLFDKTRILSRPEASMRAALRSAEASAWDATVGPLSRDDVDALVAFIEWLSPGAWPQGSVEISKIVPGKAPFDADCIREQIELRLESIHVCYELQLEGRPELSGEIVVQFVGLPNGNLTNGQVVRDTLGDPIVAWCAANAVGDASASCPVPPVGGTVTFVFSRDKDAPQPSLNAIPLRLIY